MRGLLNGSLTLRGSPDLRHRATHTFQGMPVTVAPVYETVPRFPDKPMTKRRRRRVVGRYGSWNVTRPSAYSTPFGLVMHPKVYARLKQASEDNAGASS